MCNLISHQAGPTITALTPIPGWLFRVSNFAVPAPTDVLHGFPQSTQANAGTFTSNIPLTLALHPSHFIVNFTLLFHSTLNNLSALQSVFMNQPTT
jgi:hypothetical protein